MKNYLIDKLKNWQDFHDTINVVNITFKVWGVSQDSTINANLSFFSYKNSHNGRANLLVETE